MANKAFVDYEFKADVDLAGAYRSLVSDPLTSLDAGKWSTFGSGVSFSPAGLQVGPSASPAGLSANRSYDLRGHAITATLVNPGSAGTSGSGDKIELTLQAQQVTTNTVDDPAVFVEVVSGQTAFGADGAVGTVSGYPWFGYVRIREWGGLVHIETSSDGDIWTEQRTVYTSLDLSAVYPVFVCTNQCSTGSVWKDFSYGMPNVRALATVTEAVILDSGSVVLATLGSGLPSSVEVDYDYSDSSDNIKTAVTTAVKTAAGDSTLTVVYPKYT